MLDPFAAHLEHQKVIQANVEANLRRDRQPKPKRPKPQTSFIGSWAHSEQLRKERGESLKTPPAFDSGWITLRTFHA